MNIRIFMLTIFCIFDAYAMNIFIDITRVLNILCIQKQ